MIVEKFALKDSSSSCNFCKRGVLKTSEYLLTYPYDYVYEFKSDNSGLCAVICEDCLTELKEKAERAK